MTRRGAWGGARTPRGRGGGAVDPAPPLRLGASHWGIVFSQRVVAGKHN